MQANYKHEVLEETVELYFFMWGGEMGSLNLVVIRSIYTFVKKQRQWDLHLLALSEDGDTFVTWSLKESCTMDKVQNLAK